MVTNVVITIQVGMDLLGVVRTRRILVDNVVVLHRTRVVGEHGGNLRITRGGAILRGVAVQAHRASIIVNDMMILLGSPIALAVITLVVMLVITITVITAPVAMLLLVMSTIVAIVMIVLIVLIVVTMVVITIVAIVQMSTISITVSQFVSLVAFM